MTVLDGLIAFAGAFSLIVSKKLLNKIVFALVGFSTGALLSGAFFHLLSESIGKMDTTICFAWLLFGFLLFFIMEKFLYWHHCSEKCDVKSFTYLILFGDGIHNFIDGLVIAASFLIGIPFGIITSLLIFFHEIPQEIGDFGILIYGGLKKKKALFYNFLSQLTCVAGGICGYFFLEIQNIIIPLLPFAAGGFIYIAASDLIPELGKEVSKKRTFVSFSFLILGILFLLGMKFLI